jgi:hypothetical protein
MYKKIWATLLLVWLPFLFITDFFPLFRFGMFAEPVLSKQRNQEIFRLYYAKNNNVYFFNTYFFGIDEGVFNYLVRKYYYQGKMKDFEKKFKKLIHQHSSTASPQAWYIYKIRVNAHTKDSILVARYENE